MEYIHVKREANLERQKDGTYAITVSYIDLDCGTLEHKLDFMKLPDSKTETLEAAYERVLKMPAEVENEYIDLYRTSDRGAGYKKRYLSLSNKRADVDEVLAFLWALLHPPNRWIAW